MTHLDQLEFQSIYILREAYAHFKNLALLWSIGKDSTVLLWLSRKAFFGHAYFDQGKGERYRSVGCYPCTFSVASEARSVDEIIQELQSGKFANVAERSGRAQDQEDGGLESLRREGYM